MAPVSCSTIPLSIHVRSHSAGFRWLTHRDVDHHWSGCRSIYAPQWPPQRRFEGHLVSHMWKCHANYLSAVLHGDAVDTDRSERIPSYHRGAREYSSHPVGTSSLQHAASAAVLPAAAAFRSRAAGKNPTAAKHTSAAATATGASSSCRKWLLPASPVFTC